MLTRSVSQRRRSATPRVSDSQDFLTYAGAMKVNGPGNWGRRFRNALKAKQMTLAEVAEKLDQATSTVRSWTNSNRNIKLHDFFRLCAAAGLDPAVVLFSNQGDHQEFLTIGEAWRQADQTGREALLLTAEGILGRREGGRRHAAS